MDGRVQVRVSAYALATENDRILLTRLSDASPIFAPGLWHLPGGGIDPGEQPTEALARELREETGLELVDAQLIDAKTYSVHRQGVDWNLLALFYAVVLTADAPRVVEVDGATDQVVWIPVRALRDSMLSPAASDGLRLLREAPRLMQ